MDQRPEHARIKPPFDDRGRFQWRPGMLTIFAAMWVGGWLLVHFVLLPGYTY